MVSAIVLLSLIALPIIIIKDSEKRFGKPKWCWAGVMTFLMSGTMWQNLKMTGGGFNRDPMAALGTAFAVLFFGYGIYWIFTGRKSGKSN